MGLDTLGVYAGPGEFAWGTKDTGITAAINEPTDGIDAVETTIPYDTLAGASAMPSSGIIKIGTELIKYTGTGTGTLTGCVRGYLFTTAAAHADGAAITVVEMEVFETLGDIEIDLSALNERQILRTDQGGIKKIIAGIETDTVKVKIPIAEVSYNRLKEIFESAATEVVDSVAPTTKKYFKVQSRAGEDLTANSGDIATIRYLADVNAGNFEICVSFPKLCMISLPNLSFKSDQQVYEVEFEAVAEKLGSDTKGTYLTIGDITARA